MERASRQQEVDSRPRKDTWREEVPARVGRGRMERTDGGSTLARRRIDPKAEGRREQGSGRTHT